MQNRIDFNGTNSCMKSDNLLLIYEPTISFNDKQIHTNTDLEIDSFVDSIILQPLDKKPSGIKNIKTSTKLDHLFCKTQSIAASDNKELNDKLVEFYFSDQNMNCKSEDSLNIPFRKSDHNIDINDLEGKITFSNCNSFSSYLNEDESSLLISNEEKKNVVDSVFHVTDVKHEFFNEISSINDTQRTISSDKEVEVYSQDKTGYLKRRRGRPKLQLQKTHSCSVCYKVFTRKTHLTTHLRIHSNDRPYRCILCFKQFRDNSVLTKHIRVHTQYRPYSCATCGKAFTQKGNMKRHTRQHSNEKPFTCSVCFNGFTTKSHLQIHFRIHIDEKPFTCKLCEKSFRQKSHLMRHSLIHTKQKPYSCNLCDKRFRQEQHLTRHKTIHIKGLVTNILFKQCIINGSSLQR